MTNMSAIDQAKAPALMPKKPVGRPSKYKPEYCDDIISYFSVDHTYLDAEGRVRANPLPLFEGFAILLGVCFDTLHEWRKTHPEFTEAYKRAGDLQRQMWIANSMAGLYNTAFTIFAGKNMFRWSDRQEIEHSGPDGGPITIQPMVSAPPEIKTIEEWEAWKKLSETKRLEAK